MMMTGESSFRFSWMNSKLPAIVSLYKFSLPSDPLISTIVGHKIFGQVYQHLTTYHFIAMHVTNIFEHWLHQTSSLHIVTQLDICQRSSLYRLSHRANLECDIIEQIVKQCHLQQNLEGSLP